MLPKSVLLPVLGLYFALLNLTSVNGDMVNYNNYQVYELRPNSQDHLKIISTMQTSSDALMFLDDTLKIGFKTHVAVAPHRNPDFLEVMRVFHIPYSVVESNLQQAFDNGEWQVHSYGLPFYDWDFYYDLESTYNWLHSLEKQYKSSVYTVRKYGESSEGKELLYAKISGTDERSLKYGITSERLAIFIAAGEHGNEWISSAVATYIINKLLTFKNSTNGYDWYIVPHVNPDGYDFTRTTDRLWRKTRSAHSSCFGVDLNRNWGKLPKSPNMKPCSTYYNGAKELSEPENKSLLKLLQSIRSRGMLLISLHGFSNKLLYPNNAAGDFDPDMDIVSFRAVEAMKDVGSGAQYTSEIKFQKCNTYEGTLMNRVLSDPQLDTTMAFTYELGTTDDTKFNSAPWMQLPGWQIKPNGEMFFHSVLEMAHTLKYMGYGST